MKLAFRFLLSTLLGILVVVAGSTWLQLRRELDLFDSDLERDHRVLARSLVPAFNMTWEHEGRSAALALLERVNASEGLLQSRFLPADASDAPAPALGSPDGLIQTVRQGSKDADMLTFAPVKPGGAPGFIEISESTHPRRRYVTESVIRALLSGLGLLAWCAASSIGLGFLLIARPVRALVAQARRIGKGEFQTGSGPRYADELGQLGTEMNHMAALLDQSRLELAREAKGRLQALNQLRHADRLATAGKLASGIAHELGTPLSVVLGRAKMLGSESGVSDVRRNAQIIEAQVARMTRIIRQLLDFARAGESNRAPIEAKLLVERVSSLLLPLAQKQGTRLSLGPLLEDGSVDADAEQIEQVLTNLVMNALQALREGGAVTVSISRETAVDPQQTSAEDCVVLHVDDTGPGMPSQVAARVFEPFFTTKGIGEGTGLGLSVAYGIVREHGGFLSVSSVVGQGSRFSIHLPALPAAREIRGIEKGRAGLSAPQAP